MKVYGDIPADHLELINELETLENWFNEHGSELPILLAAKGFTCMAHDYFIMEIEEEGERLLRLADKHCPGYFHGAILIHIEKHSEFAYLVKSLKSTLALETMISLGFVDE